MSYGALRRTECGVVLYRAFARDSVSRYARCTMEEHTAGIVCYTNITITEQPGSELEITGEIPTERAHVHRIQAIKKFQKELELPGFRKGHVPDDMVIAHVGEASLMQEAAERGIAEAYAALVEDRKLEVVGRPAVTVTKLAPGNPIGFKITSAVYPTVTLPNYIKIAAAEIKKHESPDTVEVTSEELAAELARLQDILARAETAGATDNDSADTGETKPTPALPELNDEFARKLGGFKDLADLKEKISTGLLADKKQKMHDKRRLALADAIISATTVTVPNVFIDGEVNQMLASFEERVTRAGMTMDAYLKQVSKTMEDLRKEWRPDAEKRAKLQIIFNEIGHKENLRPDAEKLEREVAHITEHYPDAHAHSVRAYVAAQMTNDLVFRFLEGESGVGKNPA